MGVLSSAGLFGPVCALGPGGHGHLELLEMCVRGRDLGEVVFPTPLFISISHISLAHIALLSKHVSQMTMAFIFTSF